MTTTPAAVPPSPQQLLAAIARVFPEIRWDTYRYITEGWDHAVIILDEQVVFRFPLDAEYAALLQSEIELLATLKPLVEVTIPDYQFITPNYGFAGYPIVPGIALSAELFEQLAELDRAAIAHQLGQFLTTMHEYTERGYKLSPAVVATMPQDQADLKIHVTRDLVSVLTDWDYQLVEAIMTDVDELLASPAPAVLLHGDIYNRHLLWDKPTQRLGIIDFSDKTLGDPAFDFAELYEYGRDFVEQVYAAYEGPKDDTFLERAWTYQCWTAVYMMADHFIGHKTSFEEARETFDRIRVGIR